MTAFACFTTFAFVPGKKLRTRNTLTAFKKVVEQELVLLMATVCSNLNHEHERYYLYISRRNSRQN